MSSASMMSMKTKNICKLFVFKKLKDFLGVIFSRVFFYWEGGGAFPQNSYKPSQDLWEAKMLRRIRLVQQLLRSIQSYKGLKL